MDCISAVIVLVVYNSYCCRFYGTFCAQLYYYWANYQDNIVLQSYVAIVGYVYPFFGTNLTDVRTFRILESVHTGLCIHIFYQYLVNAWGDPSAADKVVVSVCFLLTICVNALKGLFLELLQCGTMLCQVTILTNRGGIIGFDLHHGAPSSIVVQRFRWQD